MNSQTAACFLSVSVLPRLTLQCFSVALFRLQTPIAKIIYIKHFSKYIYISKYMLKYISKYTKIANIYIYIYKCVSKHICSTN